MNKIKEQDFNEIIEYVLDIYCGYLKYASEEFIDEKLYKKFGTLTAVISKEEVDNNQIRGLHYEILNQNGSNIVSFIIGNAAMLYAKRTQSYRENLLLKHKIKGVITLKQKIFKKICIPAAIIVFNDSNGDIWFTSQENKDLLMKNLLCEFGENQKVYWSNKINVKSFMPEYYNGELQEIEKILSGKEVKKLGDLATILAGKGAKQEDFAEMGIPYLRDRDIQNSKITTPIKYISYDKIEKFNKQLLQIGDILLSKNFGQNKIALVTEGNLPAIASNGLFIIRPYGVSEGYLYKYLMSKTGNAVFNKQMIGIQQGVTIPNVALSDLPEVLVPIYDEETMENIENIDTLNKTEIIEVAKKLASNNCCILELEKKVYDDLIESGWRYNNFLNNLSIFIEDNKIWNFDFVYVLPDKRKVYFDIKTDLSRVRIEWILAIKKILYGEENCFFILTTGSYYEVHASGIERSLKLVMAPTIENILNWEKEVR